MRHCCEFKADDIYYLKETNLYTNRKLSIGYCPICQKPVAELVEIRFDGAIERFRASGLKANDLLTKHSEEILYSMRECIYKKLKSKPISPPGKPAAIFLHKTHNQRPPHFV